MLHNLRQLFRYRGLVQSLVSRELKARYRGSVLGFFWSFINPLMLLLIYSFVFTVVLPNQQPKEIQPYSVFVFAGLLPWTWFSSSLLESSNALLTGGNLIKKVLFPAEVLPIVAVIANMVHFFFGLPILGLFIWYYGIPLLISELLWFPVVVALQFVFTLGLGLLLAALTVHFRDLRDILGNLLTFWFFSTPIIYSMTQAPGIGKALLNLNPFTHFVISYQEILLYQGPFGHWRWLLVVGAIGVVQFFIGYFVFDRLRETFAEEV